LANLQLRDVQDLHALLWMPVTTALVKLEFIAVVRLPRRGMGRAAATARRRSCVGGGGRRGL